MYYWQCVICDNNFMPMGRSGASLCSQSDLAFMYTCLRSTVSPAISGTGQRWRQMYSLINCSHFRGRVNIIWTTCALFLKERTSNICRTSLQSLNHASGPERKHWP